MLTSGEVKTTSDVEVWLIIVVHLPRAVTLPIVPHTLLRTGRTRSLCPPHSLFLGLKHPWCSLVVDPLPVITLLLPPFSRALEREVTRDRQPPHRAPVLLETPLILSRYRSEDRLSRLPVCLQVGTPLRTHLTLTKVNPRVLVATSIVNSAKRTNKSPPTMTSYQPLTTNRLPSRTFALGRSGIGHCYTVRNLPPR